MPRNCAGKEKQDEHVSHKQTNATKDTKTNHYTSSISTGPAVLSEKLGLGTRRVPFTASRS